LSALISGKDQYQINELISKSFYIFIIF